MSDDSNKNSFWDKLTDIASRAVNPGAITNTGVINTCTPTVVGATGGPGGITGPNVYTGVMSGYGAVPPSSSQPLWVSSNGPGGPYYSSSTDSFYYGSPTYDSKVLEEIFKRLDSIEQRLMIVNPDKALLEKYPDLAAAYEQYKSLQDQYRTYDILKENKENG